MQSRLFWTFVGSSLAVALAGCPAKEQSHATPSSAVVPSAAPAVPVASAAPARSAAPAAPVTSAPLGGEVSLTWTVHPPVGQGEQAKRRLELVVRSGAQSKRVDLGPQIGALLPQNQSVCGAKQIAYKKQGKDVAKVTFYIGGAGSFAVTRTKPETLEVVEIHASDGYCPTNDCETRRVVTTIPVPADATFVEALTDIEVAGKEKPFDCGK